MIHRWKVRRLCSKWYIAACWRKYLMIQAAKSKLLNVLNKNRGVAWHRSELDILQEEFDFLCCNFDWYIENNLI